MQFIRIVSVRENMGDFRKLAFILMFPSQLPNVPLAIIAITR